MVDVPAAGSGGTVVGAAEGMEGDVEGWLCDAPAEEVVEASGNVGCGGGVCWEEESPAVGGGEENG